MKTVTIDSRVSGIYEVSFNENFPILSKKIPNKVTTTIGHYISSFVLVVVSFSLIAKLIVSRPSSLDGFSNRPSTSIAFYLSWLIFALLSWLWFSMYEKRMRLVQEYSLVTSCIKHYNNQDYVNALNLLIKHTRKLKVVSKLKMANLAYLYKVNNMDDLARECLNYALGGNPNNTNQQVRKL